MKIGISPRGPFTGNAPRVLKIVEYLFWAAGVLALGYCAMVVLYARLYQSYARRSFDDLLRSKASSPSLLSPLVKRHAEAEDLVMAAARSGSPFGRIEIPRLGLSVMIADGDDDGTLRKGVGHIPDTAFPGQTGNVGLAAHRDTFFRPLEKIRPHDEITLTTLDGVYHYQVQSLQIVEPNDVQVLDPQGGQTLTLVTCYPFHYIGSAPHRFIVHAQRIGDSDEAKPQAPVPSLNIGVAWAPRPSIGAKRSR